MPGQRDNPVNGAPTLAVTTSPPDQPTTTGASGAGLAAQIAAKLQAKRKDPSYNYRATINALVSTNRTGDNETVPLSPSSGAKQFPEYVR